MNVFKSSSVDQHNDHRRIPVQTLKKSGTFCSAFTLTGEILACKAESWVLLEHLLDFAQHEES